MTKQNIERDMNLTTCKAGALLPSKLMIGKANDGSLYVVETKDDVHRAVVCGAFQFDQLIKAPSSWVDTVCEGEESE